MKDRESSIEFIEDETNTVRLKRIKNRKQIMSALAFLLSEDVIRIAPEKSIKGKFTEADTYFIFFKDDLVKTVDICTIKNYTIYNERIFSVANLPLDPANAYANCLYVKFLK